MKNKRMVVRGLLLAVVGLSFTAASSAQIAVGVSVRIGPPALPVYAQPICPGPGFIWTPGYWAWNDDGGYYWVPGTWVVAPVGQLWTPGYWGWGGGFYAWHAGYWGPHVGFYGGINYGFGYGGVGFAGGEWRGGSLFYNRSVTNVSVTNVTHVYNKTVVVNNTATTSYNGGSGGVQMRPTAQEEAAGREQHTAALASQTQHEQTASQNRGNFASANHGRPAIAATARAGDFSSRSAISSRSAGGEYHAPTMTPQQARGPSTPASTSHPNGGSTTAPRSNDGFRPFTPPNSSNTRNGSNSGFQNKSGGQTQSGSQHRNTSNSSAAEGRSGGSSSAPRSSYQPKNNPGGGATAQHNQSRPSPSKPASRPHNSNPAPHRQSPPAKPHGR